MVNVPVGPNRVSPAGQGAEDAPSEQWRESVAASSRNAGNSFRTTDPRKPSKKGGLRMKLIIAAVVVGLLAVLFGFWSHGRGGPSAHIDNGKYQAVFFTNGQVYFGKLNWLGSGYYRLTDVYYIQASPSPEAAADSENPQATTAEGGSDVKLIKLGNEVHGPDDEMIISKEQVLFFENLKKDGKVSESIAQYRSQKQ